MEIVLPAATAALYLTSGSTLWTNMKLHGLISGDDDQEIYLAERAGHPAAWTVKGMYLAFWPLIMLYGRIAGWIEDRGNRRKNDENMDDEDINP